MNSLTVRIAFAVTCIFFLWHAIGLSLSPLGEFTPREPEFQVGARRASAAALAQTKVGVACDDELTPDYCGDNVVWSLDYRDWGPIYYPRYSFVRLRFEGDVVVEAEGYRHFWIVI